MNFIAHRSIVEIDPSVESSFAMRDENLSNKLRTALDAVEKFDWRKLHTACINGSFGSPEAIDMQIKELCRFLVLKSISDEDASPSLIPSKVVERIWRLLILFTKDYRYLCDKMLTEDVECRFIDHDPLDNTKESKHVRYYNTMSLYCKIFKEMPPQQVWPHPEPLKRKKAEHLSSLNTSLSPHDNHTHPPSCSTTSSKKRIRFSPEVEVKVYTRDSVSTSPPVAVNYFKPVSLQVTPTRGTSTSFTFESPTPPSTPQPSAFLLACQRVVRATQAAVTSSESTSSLTSSRYDLTQSPPTLPVNVFSSMEITPEKTSPHQQITLRFLDMDKEGGGDKFDLNTKFGTSFRIILASYKKKRNIFSYRSVKYRGVEINETMTPSELGMTSHDKIEVFGSIFLASMGSNSSNSSVIC